MINFTKYEGPFGIPVFHQQLPSIVESVGIDWLIFTGSADDEEVGKHGIYHWFEHVPFRGTQRFPGGYKGTKGPLTKYAGKVAAYTNTVSTCYWAHTPNERWKLGFDITLDLWSAPLLLDPDIEAERKIIFEEIRLKNSDDGGRLHYRLPEIMWPDHPYGHHTLGSEQSLSSIDSAVLRQAYKLGYDRSRAALFVSGNIPVSEVLDYLEKEAQKMPVNSLTERRNVVTRGNLPPWKHGHETIVETEFTSSNALLLFPLKGNLSIRERVAHNLLSALVGGSGSDSPLYRIVREERQLAYATNIINSYSPDGGYWGLQVSTGKDSIELACQAMHDVITDENLRSQARFEEIQNSYQNSPKMRALSPSSLNDTAINTYISLGEIISDKAFQALIATITLDEVVALIDNLTPDHAHTVVFKGMG